MSEHDGSSPVSPSETSPLLHGAAARNGGGKASEGAPPEATLASTELKVILTTSFPLICAFLMEQSFTVVTIFSVGHIGKVELSATSIASLTANITGYAVCQGVASCLDTLCPSAYGSGNKKLVGLHFQRTTLFLLLVCIPIAVMWLNSAAILSHFMKQENVIKMAGLYLQILVLGLPGYASFECGKRFMIAQGLFVPTMWILGFCAPLNCFLNWLFVWQFGWGFIGAPISVVIVETLLPVLLFLYARYIQGVECWNELTEDVFKHWWPMIKLAVPSAMMVVAECMSFEVITLASSFISLDHLAAQTILSTFTTTAYMIHFPISIAASTRVSTLIGEGRADAARTTAKVSAFVAIAVGCLLAISYSSLRNVIPALMTDNIDVISLASATLPFTGLMEICDAFAISCNSSLRGIGRQKIGGWAALVSYYVIGIPVSFVCGFWLQWGLTGFAFGIGVGLLSVALIETLYMASIQWSSIVEE